MAADAREQFREPGARALDPGRHKARRDDRRLEQPEVVATEIKDIVDRRQLRLRAEVDAREANHRLRDHPEVGLDRRARGRVAAVHTEVDGDIQHPRALGEIHPQEEDVAPPAMGEVHAHRRELPQEWKSRGIFRGGEQLASHP